MKIIVQVDGGAARGYLPLVAMEWLESATKISFNSRTDLLCGTSTGSIICGSLAAGVTASELRRTYEEKTPYLFKKRFILNPFRWAKGMFDRKKFINVINHTLDKYAIKQRGDTRKLKNLDNTYMSTAYDLVDEHTMFFKSDASKDAYLDLTDVIAWSALSAAGYFGAIDAQIAGKWHRFNDGGQGVKNCTLLDCIDETEIRGWDKEECIIISFGCGYPKRGRNYKYVKKWGTFRQAWDYIFGGQTREEVTYDQVRRALARSDRKDNLHIFRLDMELPEKVLDFGYRNVSELHRLSKEYINQRTMRELVNMLREKLG